MWFNNMAYLVFVYLMAKRIKLKINTERFKTTAGDEIILYFWLVPPSHSFHLSSKHTFSKYYNINRGSIQIVYILIIIIAC